jgi:site-specific DNA-methyltransferase (cytosine-N4-specific)
VTLHCGDARTIWQHLPKQSVHAIVTSPPYYGLRDYGVDGQLGLEASPGEYIETLADLLTAWGTSVLRADGSLWLNLGDTYAAGGSAPPSGTSTLRGNGHIGGGPKMHDTPTVQRPRSSWPAKCLLMIPERVALALIERGWILRNRVVWAKLNGMPSSATDRLATKHEALFHFVRQPRYHYDLDAIREPYGDAKGRNMSTYRHGVGKYQDAGSPGLSNKSFSGIEHPAGANPGDVWTIPTQPYPDAHFAVMPAELVRRPILATVPEHGTVADPFAGAGTTAVMARRLGRRSLLVELNADYCQLIRRRLAQDVLTFDVAAGS